MSACFHCLVLLSDCCAAGTPLRVACGGLSESVSFLRALVSSRALQQKAFLRAIYVAKRFD